MVNQVEVYSPDKYPVPAMSPEFQSNIRKFKQEWFRVYDNISRQQTPKRDKKGTQVIKEINGLDYIIEGYMRSLLDRNFPGWSWEATSNPLQIVLNYVVVAGHLKIIDEHLLAFGIIPPYRYYMGIGGARIQFKSGQPQSPQAVVDIDKNVKSANSNALKVAINRLCHIGDDVYHKRIDEEGLVIESNEPKAEIIIEKDDLGQLGYFISDNRISPVEAMKILNIDDFRKVADVNEAIKKIKEARGMK